MRAYGVWVAKKQKLGSWAIDLVEVHKKYDPHSFEGKFVSEIVAQGDAPTVFEKGNVVNWENYQNIVETLEEAYREVMRQLWQ
jgi:hypothetical protein